MADGATSNSLLSELFVSGVLPGIGAYIAIWINDKLKSRSVARSLHANDILYLRDLVSTTRVMASEYWKIFYFDFDKQRLQEAKITGALHGCSEIIASLEGITDSQRLKLNDALGGFRRSCTSGDFGTSRRVQNVDLLRAIEADGRALEAIVMACRWK
ncbi:hypothetical protein L6172_04875 [Thalassospiraceae bacterium SW-3-3]|nr:hypothetical protein L6172_04875 [Thalassospiraceae bacterium SW-3-3]